MSAAARKRPAKVSEEIRQRVPFSSLEREAAVTLLKTGDVLRHAIESTLRPWGVSPEQYNVLRILRGAGEEGLPTLEIADRMLARSPNITRLVDKMVEKGLAERRARGEDRRVVRVVGTDKARALLAELDAATEESLGKLSSMPRAHLRELVALLDEIRDRLAVPTVREAAQKRTPAD
jgi:DNA-binding MarR family transcriptional regulator